MRFRYVAILATCICLLGLWATTPVTAAPRTVCVEAFTEWGCPPCAAWNPTERLVLDRMTRDTVVAIKYHVWWPQGNDAFYFWNTSEAAARTNFYGVNAVPAGFVDGVVSITRSESGFRNQLRARRNIAAPCTISMFAVNGGATAVHVTGTITATDSALTNAKLYVVLITDSVRYTSAPGANGETFFPDIFRDLWPGATGQAINIPLNGTYNIDCMLNREAAWDPEDLSVIAFIQSGGSGHWIHQAAWAHVRNLYSCETSSTDERQVIGNVNEEMVYTVHLRNLGSNNDIYRVALQGALPANWTRTVESNGGPTSSDSIMVPLNSLQEQTVTVRIHPHGHGGTSNFTVDALSTNDPISHDAESFRFMSGLEILYVDDDRGATTGDQVEQFYLNALAPITDRAIGYWDLEAGTLYAEDMADIRMLIWATGSSPLNGTISIAEEAMLTDYLAAGGKLFLTGQGIASDLRTSQFLSDYLHVSFGQTFAAGRNVQGIASDPIGNGLSFSIFSGDGDGNQIRQSTMAVRDAAATIIFDYAGGQNHAAARIDGGSYKAVFFGFGFEAISPAPTRETVMGRVVNWLLGTSDVEPTPDMPVPQQYDLAQNFPNPFNPETTIPYAVPERANVSLRIFDMLGREVAVLANGMQDAGNYTAHWNAAGIPSGLYFYRFEATSGTREFHATRKLMLLK
jgi:hypothetical protein